jgi:ribonuclease-3
LAPELSVEDRERVARLAERVRAPLADRATALAAITHKSWVNEHRADGGEDNERLEFLGDAVIDLLVSDYLMSRFPLAREGDLSKLRAAVVDEPGLAAMSRSLRLGELLRLGRGEELTGGREKVSLLADAMEAVVAAVFLDGGLAAVHRLVDPFLEVVYAAAANGSIDRDFKTQLQEQAQARFRTSPRYRVVAELGPDHAKTFEIEVELRGEILGRGTGRSKKDAEQAAARIAVDALTARPAEAVPVAPPVEAEPAAAAVAPPPAVPEPVEPPPAGPPPVEPPPEPPKARKARKPSSRKAPAAGTPRKGKVAKTRKIAAKRVRD